MQLSTLTLRLAFNASYREKVWRKLATQISHGLGLYRCIENLASRSQAKGEVVANAYEQLLENNAAGGSLAEGLAPLATPSEIMLISAGEQDNLAQGLFLAADLLKNQGLIKKQVWQSTAYPCFLFLLLGLLLLIIAHLLVPQFAAILPEGSLQGAGQALFSLAHVVSSWLGLGLLGTLICLMALIAYSLPRLTGEWRKILDRYPPWSVYREVVGASFLYTLSLMLSLGVKPREIFAWLLDQPGQTPYLKERIMGIDNEMALGKNLGQALDDAGFEFPGPTVIDDLLVYSELPNFEKQIGQIAREELEACVETVRSKLKTLQIILLFLVVGLIFFVLVALGSLQQALGYL